jgi:hypothetical protein
MKDVIKNIIREEFENAMSKKYSEDEVRDAINRKHFIHSKDGKVYSPVVIKRGFFTGVNSNNEHIDIPLEEITLIQSKKDRFGQE